MGAAAAENVLRDVRGEPRRPFRYRDKGMLATIGRASAVARIGRFHFGGAVAWLLWLFVHVLFLVGFRNRVAVVLEWAWAYATFGRPVRLITGPLASPLPEIAPAGPPAPEAEREPDAGGAGRAPPDERPTAVH
jgi:NADH dehydrogenase